MFEDFLTRKLQGKKDSGALRILRLPGGHADYFSNDYLGITKNKRIEENLRGKEFAHGSTGSRLLAGNYSLIEEVEKKIARFHNAETALIFNSGYDANFGLLACIAGKEDLIIYDKLSHASIRDGIRQSFGDSHPFAHNDLDDLEKKLKKRKGNCFVVTESVFSMDGDMAPLIEMAELCEKYGANLIVDEAHATGLIGDKGEGVVQKLNLQNRCFARVHTFGKALGCHGAAILGSALLRNYLINFCRPLIYSTALPPAAVAGIKSSYDIFPEMIEEREFLKTLIDMFDIPGFKKSVTAIQCIIIPGNKQVKQVSQNLLEFNIDVRPILYPTVPLGEERLRIALHSFNTVRETKNLISILTK
jgi:8-amino-7-oxononanoate synthase